MALAVLLPIRVTQKHRAQNLKIIFRKKGGRSSLQRLSEIGHCSHCTYRKKATENIPKTSSAAKVRLEERNGSRLPAQTRPANRCPIYTDCGLILWFGDEAIADASHRQQMTRLRGDFFNVLSETHNEVV